MGVGRGRADEWEALREIRLAALADSPDAFGSTLVEERDADEVRWRGWITGGVGRRRRDVHRRWSRPPPRHGHGVPPRRPTYHRLALRDVGATGATRRGDR